MSRVLLSWSGGKDSALALNAVRYELDVAALLTTVTKDYDRISMHGVRRKLLEAQAAARGIPLHVVTIPKECTKEDYEARMGETMEGFIAQGIEKVIFGDLFLEDIRAYREEKLAQVGMTALFPLWGRDTAELAREFIELGFRAVLTCIDPKVLDPSFVGRAYDEALLKALPSEVDPCGENGEFHTFVLDGPGFAHPIPALQGERVEREGFWFCDLVPA